MKRWGSWLVGLRLGPYPIGPVKIRVYIGKKLKPSISIQPR